MSVLLYSCCGKIKVQKGKMQEVSEMSTGILISIVWLGVMALIVDYAFEMDEARR